MSKNKNNTTSNSSRIQANRFEVINYLMTKHEGGASQESLKTYLLSGPTDDIIEIWDGLRNLMVDQAVIQEEDALMKITRRNGKKSSNGAQISAEQVYVDEIYDWLSNIHSFDVDISFQQHGIYQKTCTIKLSEEYISPYFNNAQSSQKEQLKNQQLSSINESNSSLSGSDYQKLMAAIDAVGKKVEDKIDGVEATLNNTIETKGKEILTRMTQQVTDLTKNHNLLKDDFNKFKTKINTEMEALKNNNDVRQTVTDVANEVLDQIIQERGIVNNNNRQEQPAQAPVAEQRPAGQRENAQFQRPNRPQRLVIWGKKADQTQERIGRTFNFAVGRIPNNVNYSEEWLRLALETNLNVLGLEVTIEEISLIPATVAGGRSKTFKVALKPGEGILEKDLYNEEIWVAGTRVTKFFRKRNHANNNRNGDRNNNRGNRPYGQEQVDHGNNEGPNEEGEW